MALINSYAIWNNKGGVGKSTITFHLAARYAEQNPETNVLVIDLCPQSNASMMLLGGGASGEAQLLTHCTSAIPRTVVGYAGRVVDDSTITEANPRYRFPGERQRDGKIFEFRKTLFLYNGFQIKTPVDDLVVVEGFTGVWWLDQNGLSNVVATMGADCSQKQAELIVSLVNPNGLVWILSDGDKAGARHAQILLTFISPHRAVRWLKLADGKQPTDYSGEELKMQFIM